MGSEQRRGDSSSGDPLVLATGLPDATKVIASLEFNGSQSVGVYSGAKPTATTFCLVGNNTNVPDAWWVYSKAKGGLQTASAATLVAAQGLC